MKLIRSFFAPFIILLLTAAGSAAQETSQVEMADTLRSNGKIYVVVTVLSIIFIGLIIYLIVIDRKVGRLEREMKNRSK
jgi:CcmD family protein